MTSNQTIDGVPRRLLDTIMFWLVRVNERSETDLPELKELRALLNAPTHVHEWDINAEGTATVCQCGARWSDELAARSQGDPVAALYVSRESFDDEACVGMHGTKYPTPVQDMPLYAEQPAPAAVALPERRAVSTARDQAACANSWNACLDEVTRLNSRSP